MDASDRTEGKMNFLVPGMLAFGRIKGEIYPTNSSWIAEYLGSVRKYNRLEIQPLIVQAEDAADEVWYLSPCADYSIVASRYGVYEIRLTDPNLKASDLEDALHGMMAVLGGVSPEIFVIPVEEAFIPSSRIINQAAIIEFYKSTLPYPSNNNNEVLFLDQWSRGHHFDGQLWALLAYVIGDQRVIFPSLFLRAATEKYLFQGDDIENTNLRDDEAPNRIVEAVDIESALINTYKIVEAVYGGPLGSDWRKISRHFSRQGINTDELVGYSGKSRKSVLEKIKLLKDARDDRAAHGRIHSKRQNTYWQLMDYQALAKHLLIQYIHNKYPLAIEHREKLV